MLTDQEQASVAAHVQLLELVSAGKLTQLLCPQCGQSEVETVVTDHDGGRTYCYCLACDFTMRAQGKPPSLTCRVQTEDKPCPSFP